MQPDDALNDAALDRELQRALAVEPSPEFVAGVRMRVASEPARTPWRASWLFAAAAAAAVVVTALVVQRMNRGVEPAAVRPLLMSRSLTPATVTIPGAAPSGVSAPARAVDTTARPEGPALHARRAVLDTSEPEVLIDMRESMALRALISGVRGGRVDLTPVLRASTPTAMDLPPVEDLQIPVITIEPLAPMGAEGVRQ